MGIIEAIEQELKKQAYDEGLEKGVADGLEQGMIQERTKIILSLLQSGFTTSEIASFLKVDISFIE